MPNEQFTNRQRTTEPIIARESNGPQLPPVADINPSVTYSPTGRSSHLKLWLGVAVLIVAAASVTFLLLLHDHSHQASNNGNQHDPATATVSSVSQKVLLDAHKNYGNKYANGLLPVGDGKYVTAGAKQGYVYACGQYAQNLASDKGGASARGPWFTNNNTEYDINKKIHVSGSVTWQSSFNDVINGNQRTITTNGLPNHATGVFPIAATDSAYAYDRNPNSIKSQDLTFILNANPAYGSPQCMGGEAGIMLTGVPIFSAFDAGGRDAGAWEVQDDCSGHPQEAGEYHYHTLSSCVTDTSVSTVIGFALDGYAITGPTVGKNNILTTADLDICHGITSQINLDGKEVTTYHYVMTQDFPYSVSCFRSKPTPTTPAGNQQGQTGQAAPQPGYRLPPPPQ